MIATKNNQRQSNIVRLLLSIVLALAIAFGLVYATWSVLMRSDAVCHIPVVPNATVADNASIAVDDPTFTRELRGIWVATVGNINYPSSNTLRTDPKKQELDKIIANCAAWNMNTIFFQVCPSADALYESSYFPVSSYFNKNRELDFDPLAYLIKYAHAQNIDVYAWVNPLRVTYGSTTLASLPNDHAAKVHPDWVVSYGGNDYFDAGNPDLRSYIGKSVGEIAARYAVDGIVFDDYFYPYPVTDNSGNKVDFGDSASYKKYGGNKDLGDWRRENINALVKTCYDAVNTASDTCQFGISPFGIWQNDDGQNGGSQTSGLQSYQSLYCDTLAWIKGGYVDFIAPQLYWEETTEAAPYDTLTDWWGKAVADTKVKLYISHAAYKYLDWDDAGEMTRQITYARKKYAYGGSILYGYSAMQYNDNGITSEIQGLYQDEIFKYSFS